MHSLLHCSAISTLFPFLTNEEAVHLVTTNRALCKKWIPVIVGLREWICGIDDIPISSRQWIRKLWTIEPSPLIPDKLLTFPNLRQLQCRHNGRRFPNLAPLSSVTVLKFHSWSGCAEVNVLHLPRNLSYLHISAYGPMQIKGCKEDYPSHLTTMKIGRGGIDNNDCPWPPYLTNLSLRYDYHGLNTLGSSLTILTLKRTNRALYDLPMSLTRLTLVDWNHGHITFPPHLTNLQMHYYNLRDLPTLPNCLTELTLEKWNHPTYDGIFPDTLIKLTMFAFNQTVIHVPHGLQVLDLPSFAGKVLKK